MQSFLFTLLTPTEQIMLAKRLAIILLLHEGYEDSDISDRLHVTRITVAKLRYFLESRGEGFAPAFKVLKNEDVKNFIKEALLGLAVYTAKAAGGRL